MAALLALLGALLGALLLAIFLAWRRPYQFVVDEELTSRHRSRGGVGRAFQRHVAALSHTNLTTMTDGNDFLHGWYRDASGEHRLDIRRA